MILNQQDNQLLDYYVSSQIPTWNVMQNQLTESSQYHVELVIHADCNQKCEYCYIVNYGDKLYPKELRCDRKTILNNIKMLLDYYYEKEIFIFSWAFFAGDLFYDNFFFELLPLFKNFYSKIYEKYPNYLNIIHEKTKNCCYPEIIVPCNFSFCRDDNKISLFKKVKQEMEELNIFLDLTYSTDGKYAIDTREQVEVSDELYDKTLQFVADQNFGPHPMVSSSNVKNWIKNYDWWLEQFKKYFPNRFDYTPAMLEVRNDDWTEESINDYLKLLDYIINKRLELYEFNLDKFAASVIYFNQKDLINHGVTKGCSSIDPIHIMPQIAGQDNHMSCDIGFSFVINCYDLSLIPCHRTAYPQFHGGHYLIESNKIIGLVADEGINCYFNLLIQIPHYRVKCSSCEYNGFCIKGCVGAQFESSGDYNVPNQSVCNLFKAKFDFLFKKYHELGVFKKLFENQYPFIDYLDDKGKKLILDFLLQKGYSDYEQYR